MIGALLAVAVLAAEPGDVEAQLEHRAALKISLGYARSSGGARGIDGQGEGGLLAVEYVWKLTTWFTPRAYAGALYTNAREDSCTIALRPCEVTSRIGYVVLKPRALLPMTSWVGPFVELGGGASVGSMKTLIGTAATVDQTGLFYHVAWGVGLAVGERRQYELLLSALEHPAQKQRDGGFAVSFQFEL
jgi:hypothetical protein